MSCAGHRILRVSVRHPFAGDWTIVADVDTSALRDFGVEEEQSLVGQILERLLCLGTESLLARLGGAMARSSCCVTSAGARLLADLHRVLAGKCIVPVLLDGTMLVERIGTALRRCLADTVSVLRMHVESLRGGDESFQPIVWVWSDGQFMQKLWYCDKELLRETIAVAEEIAQIYEGIEILQVLVDEPRDVGPHINS